MTPPQRWLMDAFNYPQRKSPRLRNYDYSANNYYFITICTDQKKMIFGAPGEVNLFGLFAEKGILQIHDHFFGVKVDKFVVMPNHIHAIIILEQSAVPVTTVVGLYKSYVTKQIHSIDPNIKVWQASFHDHVIRNQRSYEKIWSYIDTNPLKWKEDCFYSE